MTLEQNLSIAREIDVYVAVTLGRRIAREIGFDEIDRTRIEIAILELTRNILVHAQRGTLSVRTLAEPRAGIEIEVNDEGPGIPDVDLALRDGYSTAATLGSGLPGVKRLMNDFILETDLNRGTTVIVRHWLPLRKRKY